MTLLAISVGAGLVLGLASGGSLHALEDMHFRYWWMLLCGLVLQLTAPLWLEYAGMSHSVAVRVIWPVSTMAILVACLANRHVTGMGVVAIGVLLNCVVICSNGGMPVSLVGLSDVAVATAQQRLNASWIHVPLSANTHIPILADVIPVPGPPGFRGLASLGDLWMAIGIASALFTIVAGCRSGRRKEALPARISDGDAGD